MDIRIAPRFVVISAIIALVLFAIFSYMIYQFTARTKVVAQVIPEDSRLFIDDQEVAGSTNYLEKGIYTFTAKKDGYKDYTTEVEVDGTDEVLVGLAPYPDSVAAFKELESNEENQYEREALGGIESNRFGIELQKNNPIIAKLPYISIKDLISVTYGNATDDGSRVFVQISNSSTQGRINSAKWIMKQGGDLSELDIRYSSRYVSPLVDRVKAERGY